MLFFLITSINELNIQPITQKFLDVFESVDLGIDVENFHRTSSTSIPKTPRHNGCHQGVVHGEAAAPSCEAMNSVMGCLLKHTCLQYNLTIIHYFNIIVNSEIAEII
jgi:hypothetical protein